MTPPLPELSDITRSTAATRLVVPPEFIDVNGHMNVQHYLHVGTLGTGTLVAAVGIDDAYRRDRGRSVFTRRHVVDYVSELILGDQVSIHSFVIDRSTTAMHLMSYVLDLGRSRVAATVEILLVHVDLASRRPVPIEPVVAAALDEERLSASATGIVHPLSGAITLRH